MHVASDKVVTSHTGIGLTLDVEQNWLSGNIKGTLFAVKPRPKHPFPFLSMLTMVFPLIPVLASPLILFTVAVSSVYTTTFERCLRPRLPVKASLTTTSSRNIAPRWSGYKAPIAGHVVNVSTEADVQAVVRVWSMV